MNIIEDVKTKEDVRDFYYKHMQYQRNILSEELKIQKRFTRAEYVHLHKILFNEEPMSYETRQAILHSIQYYFDAIERAKAI